DEPKPRGDVHVVAEALREVRLRAPLADDLVVLLAAGRDARVGQVRQLEHQLAQPLLDLLELRRQRAQLLASRGGRRLELGRVLTGPLALADLLPDPLALAAQRLRAVHELTTAAIGLQDRLELRTRTAPLESGGHLVGLLAEELKVEHRDLSRRLVLLARVL